MASISDYKNIQIIYESTGTTIRRAVVESRNLPVIIKTLRKEYPDPDEIRRFKQEYEITSRFRNNGVIRAIKKDIIDGRQAIIFEDRGGTVLKSIIGSKGLDIPKILNIGAAIIDILSKVHQSGIIHRDINPSNIILVSGIPEIQIIDFGIAMDVNHEDAEDIHHERLEGTLAYISPEQTGRLNRSVDYRTDYYSFGVTLYELLTRRLPFTNEDPMEMVHCHIAKPPPDPMKINPEIPEALSAIVMKLMSKNPENRYQSANGIHSDLLQCIEAYKNGKTSFRFDIGRKDTPGRLRIPKKLYGREGALQTLKNAYMQVRAGRMTNVFVEGYSGIGKSALVFEFRKTAALSEAERQSNIRPRFISGKFDPLQRDIPYSAFISAFTDLVRQLLSQSHSALDLWRKRIMGALGPNGQIVLDIIPDLERIIGPQPDPPPLSPAESQNRFNLIFQNFVRAVAVQESPLILFLDDLQWADSATFQLLRKLSMDQENRYLMFIGAYRDNEVDSTHPLTMTMDFMEKIGIVRQHIKLSPLSASQVNLLVAETLSCDRESASDLSELILSKTNGNPFFIGEFLKQLQTEGCLVFDAGEGEWRWDSELIRSRDITDNVVLMMSSRIERLDPETRKILCRAACVGNKFDIETVSLVTEISHGALAQHLENALSEGLIIKSGRTTADSDTENIEAKAPGDPGTGRTIMKFSHDRVQEAAYSLLSESEKMSQHLKIGRLLHQRTKNKKEVRIFAIVNHLNIGSSLIESQDERDDLAEMNLLAGKRAKLSAAYKSALTFLLNGVQLLGKNPWDRRYYTTLALYDEASESAYLAGDFELMEQLTRDVRENAKTLLDKEKAWEVAIRSLMAQNRLMDAIRLAQDVLKQLGLKLPSNPNKIHVLSEIIKTKLALRGKNPEGLVNLKRMTDPGLLAITRILSVVGHAAYIAMPNLMPIIALKMTQLSLRYGNTSFSTYSYAAYGVILCAFINDVDMGYRFGAASLMLLGRPDDREIECRTINIFNTFIRHFKEHARESLTPLAEAYRKGLETGDLEYAGIAAFSFAGYSFWVGRNLMAIESEIREYMPSVKRLNQEIPQHWYEMIWQAVLNLMGRSKNPLRLIGEVYDENKMLPIHMETNERVGICYLHFIKLFICYLFGEHEEAVQNAVIAERYLEGQVGTMTVPIFYCFDSLSRLALYESALKKQRKEILKKVAGNQRKLKQIVKHSPMNHFHKWCLVKAELARLTGNEHKALDYYKQSLRFAKQNRYVQDEALANELIARFYYKKGDLKIARVFIKDAHYNYIKWGAAAKAKHLEQESVELLNFSPVDQAHYSDHNQATVSFTTTSGNSQILDIATVLKSSQAISGEIELSHLLEKVMRIVIENAGAQKGLLILQKEGRYFIEAEADAESDRIRTLQAIPAEPGAYFKARPLLPFSIMNFVIHARESVVLNDAVNDGAFINDPYVIKLQPKSILCIPLVYRGKLTGVVYLENNLTTGAFTPERLELLTLLSSQMAISIENASLYQNLKQASQKLEEYSKTLEQKVEERTRELNLKNIKLNRVLDEVEAYNRKIRQSIEYAKRIQESLLPNTEELKTRLPKCFIIWMPRDIVGGDMFFAELFEDIILLAMVDCTGHGVPGALMTMIASSGLKQITVTERCMDPAVILKRLNFIVKTSLQQDTPYAISDDGLDAAVCRIDPANRLLTYSGARFPLFRVFDGAVSVIAGDKQSIGYKRANMDHDFSNHDIDIRSGDAFYLFSDGYTDQLGGEKGRSFGKKRLREMLASMDSISFNDRKQILLDSFDEYKGSYDRQDDVTVIGFGF